MKKQYIVIITGVLLVLLFVIGVHVYQSGQLKKFGLMAGNDASPFVRDYSPSLGSDDAKVILVKFSDPACETCSAFHPFVKKLMADNPGKVKLVIRYTPKHEGADYFCKILEAARTQGKFWETLEMMYITQRWWASHHNPQPQRIWQFLPKVGLDIERIKSDMEDPAIAKLIEQDMADADALDVRKTPGFFVNGKPLVSFGRRQLRQLVESEIRKNY